MSSHPISTLSKIKDSFEPKKIITNRPLSNENKEFNPLENPNFKPILFKAKPFKKPQ